MGVYLKKNMVLEKENISLQKKIKTLEGQDLTSFILKALKSNIDGYVEEMFANDNAIVNIEYSSWLKKAPKDVSKNFYKASANKETNKEILKKYFEDEVGKKEKEEEDKVLKVLKENINGYIQIAKNSLKYTKWKEQSDEK